MLGSGFEPPRPYRIGTVGISSRARNLDIERLEDEREFAEQLAVPDAFVTSERGVVDLDIPRTKAICDVAWREAHNSSLPSSKCYRRCQRALT